MQCSIQEIARQNRLPCLAVVDTGGAFLPLQAEHEQAANPRPNEYLNDTKGNVSGTTYPSPAANVYTETSEAAAAEVGSPTAISSRSILPFSHGPQRSSNDEENVKLQKIL